MRWTSTFFPPLWAGSFATVGTLMKNPSYTAAIKLTQTYSSSLLNETGFLLRGNKISLTPLAGVWLWTLRTQADGRRTACSHLETGGDDARWNGNRSCPPLQCSGTPLGANWNPSYFPWKNGYEGFQYRDDLSWTKGRHQFKFGVGWLHTYKNQELQANTNGTATFDNNAFSKDGIINTMMGMAASYNQLEYLYGKNWVNNNYSLYMIDNWHVNSRLTLNLGLRYDAMPHAFERYNKFSNFVGGSYNTTLGQPDSGRWNSRSEAASDIRRRTEKFYLNGIQGSRS